MSMEKSIREMHEFEDKVKQFLKIAAMLTDRELEVALGRLADIVSEQPSGDRHIQIKGEILKIYYELRKKKLRKQRKLSRWNRQAYDEMIFKQLIDFSLLPSDQFTPPTSQDKANVNDMVMSLTK